MKTALDFGRGAALDFYCPMLAAGPAQQQIGLRPGAAAVKAGRYLGWRYSQLAFDNVGGGRISTRYEPLS